MDKIDQFEQAASSEGKKTTPPFTLFFRAARASQRSEPSAADGKPPCRSLAASLTAALDNAPLGEGAVLIDWQEKVFQIQLCAGDRDATSLAVASGRKIGLPPDQRTHPGTAAAAEAEQACRTVRANVARRPR